ncbi:MAG: Rossmann-like and DUF2520 domain-containing protein [Syntrophothermus sp.]
MNNICITGAGRISYSLTAALAGKGYNITSVYSRRIQEAEKLASAFNIKCFTDTISEIPAETDLFFLAVPDSAIRTAAESMSKGNFSFNRSLFVHLSGSLNIEELESVSKKGASAASFHIMQTFPARTRVPLENCYVAVESSDETSEKSLFDIARSLLMKPFRVVSDKKVMYHLTGVFASNFIVASLYQAMSSFLNSGIEGVDFYDMIKPIAEKTIANALSGDVSGALSGPVLRGDYKTVISHIEAMRKLPENDSETLILSYAANSLALLNMIRVKEGRLSEGQQRIKDFLDQWLK